MLSGRALCECGCASGARCARVNSFGRALPLQQSDGFLWPPRPCPCSIYLSFDDAKGARLARKACTEQTSAARSSNNGHTRNAKCQRLASRIVAKLITTTNPYIMKEARKKSLLARSACSSFGHCSRLPLSRALSTHIARTKIPRNNVARPGCQSISLDKPKRPTKVKYRGPHVARSSPGLAGWRRPVAPKNLANRNEIS